MSVTLGAWYEYWLDTYMKDTVKQSTYASYRSYLNKHFCVLGKILLKKLEPVSYTHLDVYKRQLYTGVLLHEPENSPILLRAQQNKGVFFVCSLSGMVIPRAFYRAIKRTMA